jgi:Spy/CpxP family protein refolding chaperone
MKKLFVLVISLGFLASNAIAQVKREVNPSQTSESNTMKKHKKKEMMKELNLTKEQRGQMKEFHRSMKQKKENINDDQTLTDAQKKAKMEELHKEQKQKMNTILTPEQREKMKEQKKNSKPRVK